MNNGSTLQGIPWKNHGISAQIQSRKFREFRGIPSSAAFQKVTSVDTLISHSNSDKQGAPYSQLFYSLWSKSKRIWIFFASYSHVSVYSQTPFIRIIRLIFASKYSHRFAYKYLIWCKKYMSQRIFASKWIFAWYFLILAKYLLQNICLEANIRKTFSEFHIQVNIRLQIFAYKRIFTCQQKFAMYYFKLFRKTFHKS
jgi:hypothetical protein